MDVAALKMTAGFFARSISAGNGESVGSEDKSSQIVDLYTDQQFLGQRFALSGFGHRNPGI